ncbi:ubiquinone biosynthesis accessory factor UbiJ [Halopseudomonas salina]|uniref:Ubiquinone biosynthesis accessory factor UbiJ n=1 Tax=Halopseudomonas salina TaxID=1323744 RepID=A0ABQ1PFN6_9GAMM|nr:SCP2 sterol-binding domain-containing protein [Halopseudomonas salina]GGC96291.1 sterol-binding protein [Halopseudomonas salina]
MLTRAMLGAAERSLRLALERDPLTASRLAALQNKTVLVQGRNPDWQLYLQPGSNGIGLTTDSTHEPDCTLSAPSSLLAKLLISNQRQPLLQDPELHLSGDSQVLVSLQNAMADLQLDGEAELSRWLGPVPAHAVAQVARKSWEWGGGARQTLGRSLAEYLTEESGQLVGNAEAQVSADQLYQLRLDLDRLEARVQQLSDHHPETPEA